MLRTLLTRTSKRINILGSSFSHIQRLMHSERLPEEKASEKKEESNSFSGLYKKLNECDPKQTGEVQAKIDNLLQEKIRYFTHSYQSKKKEEWENRMSALDITLKELKSNDSEAPKEKKSALQAEATAEYIALQNLLSSNKRVSYGAINIPTPAEPSLEQYEGLRCGRR